MTKVDQSGGVGYLFHKIRTDELQRLFNRIFETELSGYRFIDGVITPISDKVEVTEIDDAINNTAMYGLSGARIHIRSSIELLGKKPDPDYRNSIKESISAVESVVKIISESSTSGLDGALEELSKRTDLHGALKAGFKNLYGYSSDEDGIRHAILEQPNVGFIEAKYMIVSCSAFVNYLISKASLLGMLKK